MGCCCLWNLILWFWLDGMDEIRKLNGILDEKDRDIVTDNV
jgi:hypothetical protein